MGGDAFSFVLAVGGAAMVVYSLWSFVRGLALRQSGVRAAGVVVDCVTREQNTESDNFYPIVEFTDETGTVHRSEAESPVSPRLCQAGRDVRVVYMRGNPGRFRVDQSGGRGTWHDIGHLVLGLVIIIIALMLHRGG